MKPSIHRLRRIGVVLAVSLAAALGPPEDTAPPAAADARAAAERAAVVFAARHRAVLSAEVPGRIAALRKELGEAFEAGDVLLQLDDQAYRVNRQLADAEHEAAACELTEARRLADAGTRRRHADAVRAAAEANLAATEKLFRDGHASQVDLENARRDAVAAQTECELVAANVARELARATRDATVARGKRDLAAQELASCALRAPYAGRVARVLVHEHEFVSRGTPLLEVADDRVLLAKFLLPSELFKALQIGQPLPITVSETGDTVTVHVSHVAAVLDPASVTFEVYAELDNAGGQLRAGMNGWLPLAEIRAR